jgi:hypothetical protein
MFSLIALPLISACSNTQLNVVDNLTVSSKNEGAFMSGKLIVNGHPLQTTFVSLNGQLALHAGQVCISSRFRSPFNTICLTEDELEKLKDKNVLLDEESFSRKGKVDIAAYPTEQNNSFLKELIVAVNNEKDAAAKRNIEKVSYFQCLQTKKKQEDKEPAPENVISCDSQSLLNAEKDLVTKRSERQAKLTNPNVLVYNWAESHEFDGGVIKGVAGSLEKQAAGYTVVNGVYLKRYSIDCDELTALKELGKSDRLKMVTMTLSTNELYYDANEDSAFSAQLALAISAKEFADLAKWAKDNRSIDLKADLNSATSIASQGYLKVSNKGKEESTFITYKEENTQIPELVYYAVLSDVDTLSCVD